MQPGEPKKQDEETPLSSIYEVVGGTEDEQNDVLGYHEDQMEIDFLKDFEYKGKLYKVEDFEREKTKEEQKMVQSTLDKLEEFIKEMGGVPLPIRPEQVHFLDARKAKAANLPAVNFFEAKGQFIGIYDSENNLANMQGIAHEALHFNSFQTLQIGKDKSLDSRRFGISIKTRGEHALYFNEINEAITGELTKIFDKEYLSQIPEIGKDLQERQDFISEFLKVNPEATKEADDVAFATTDPATGKKTGASYTYPMIRKRFNALVEDIFQRNSKENGGKLEDREEVLALFFGAAMGGRMLPLARIVDKTYGKGSFRKLGEVTKEPKG